MAFRRLFAFFSQAFAYLAVGKHPFDGHCHASRALGWNEEAVFSGPRVFLYPAAIGCYDGYSACHGFKRWQGECLIV